MMTYDQWDKPYAVKYTAQEAFNAVWAHAHKMTVPCGVPISANPVQMSVCRYRRNGSMCFIGALIPDELYKPDMEDVPASDLGNIMITDMPADRAKRYLAELQWAHDQPNHRHALRDSEDWMTLSRNYLEKIASVFNLDIPQ